MAGDSRSLGSFGSFAPTSLLSSAVAPIDFSAVSGEIAVVLKNIRKKDTVTKTKGLTEFQDKIVEVQKKKDGLLDRKDELEDKEKDTKNRLDKKELDCIRKELAEVNKELDKIEKDLANIVPIWVLSPLVLPWSSLDPPFHSLATLTGIAMLISRLNCIPRW
jgi:septal ring factor EnvC (AmiA/AmiB activator)